MRVQSLHREDSLEGMATYSSILAWRIPKGRGDWRVMVHMVAESDRTEATTQAHMILFKWVNL